MAKGKDFSKLVIFLIAFNIFSFLIIYSEFLAFAQEGGGATTSVFYDLSHRIFGGNSTSSGGGGNGPGILRDGHIIGGHCPCTETDPTNGQTATTYDISLAKFINSLCHCVTDSNGDPLE